MPIVPRDTDGGAPERTALYRLFNADDELLYVGITNSPETRWRHHKATQEWWPLVARKTVDWLDSRSEAAAAEIEAIHAEVPKHNLDHNINHKRPGPSVNDAPDGYGPDAIEKKITFFVENGFHAEADYWRSVRATVDQAPPLSNDQISRLRVLIWGSADRRERVEGAQ